MDDFLETFAGAVEGLNCGARGCLTTPITERNGRPVCAKHRDFYDHGIMGEPCERCESREWVADPDAAEVAYCTQCGFVTYDESVIEHSW